MRRTTCTQIPTSWRVELRETGGRTRVRICPCKIVASQSSALQNDHHALAPVWRGELRETGVCQLSLKPDKWMNFSPIRPFVGFRHQPFSDWVITDIVPLFRKMTGTANLGVPIIALPDRFFFWKRPLSRCCCPPVLSPILVGRLWIGRTTKEMNVIWHQYVAIHLPMVCLLPKRSEQVVYFCPRQQRSASQDARSDHQNCRTIRSFNWWHMNRMLANWTAR